MMTPRQRDALAFIQRYQAENAGVSPTCKEIGKALGLVSTSGVHRLLSELEDRGLIRRLPNMARAIEILKPTRADQSGLVEAARRFADQDVHYIGGRVSFEFASHGEALKAVRHLRDAIAGAGSQP